MKDVCTFCGGPSGGGATTADDVAPDELNANLNWIPCCWNCYERIAWRDQSD